MLQLFLDVYHVTIVSRCTSCN